MKKLLQRFVFGAALLALAGAILPSEASAKTFVIPHVLEKSGTINNLVIFYSGGLPGVPGKGAAFVELYLYDMSNGEALIDRNGNTVCGPCSYSLDQNARKETIHMDELITKARASARKNLSAIIVVTGDPDAVNLQGFVVNAHTSPFDLSVFGFDPQPIAAAP